MARIYELRPRAIAPIRIDERSVPGVSPMGLVLVCIGVWWLGCWLFWRAL